MGSKSKNASMNGNRQFTMNSGGRLVLNEESLSRLALMAMAGTLPPIDVDTECRYPKEITLQMYQDYYDREGIATRVVEVYPEESWAMPPEIYETEDLSNETEFEKEWKELDDRLHVLSHLQTADELSGIGQYGVVLLGFDDGRPLSEPVSGIKEDGSIDARAKQHNLLYLRSMSQSFATIKTFESNVSSPRYCQPKMYTLELAKLAGDRSNIPSLLNQITVVPGDMKGPVDVHWSRVIHICDNKSSNVLSVPRLENVYNPIWNIKKTLGAAGQGYWTSGIPSLSVETQPGIDDPEIDIDAVKAEIRDFLLGLQRSIATEGMTAKALNFTLSEPGPFINTQLDIICITKAVPKRIFLGTEEAKLASSQDMRTWNKRLMKRQKFYVTPYIVNPFFERMFTTGVLTKPKKLVCEWPDLNAPTENDKATTAQKVTDALVKYIQGNVFLIMKPREYMINVLGLSPARVQSIIEAAGNAKMLGKLDKLASVAMQPKGPVAGTNGKKNLPKRTKKPAADAGAGPAR